jgi:hypothetical protein
MAMNSHSAKRTPGVQLCGVALGALVLSQACQKSDSNESAKPAEGAVTASRPVADKEIERALEAASKQEAAPAANTPPRDGILTPSRAEAEAATGAPAKLVLGATGSEPRVKLAATEITGARLGGIELAVRTGAGAALPTVAFALKADPVKPAAEGATKRVHIDLVQADLGKEQPGQIPDEIRRQVQLIQGSSFEYASVNGLPAGATSFARGKNTPVDSELLLAAAASGLDAVLTAFPEEPVGVGAFWMLTMRSKFLGADVVSYQMVKVAGVSPDAVSLDLTTQRYAVGNQFALQGLEGSELLQFQSSDKGQIVIVPGDRYPVDGVVQQSLMAVVRTERGNGPFQLDAHVRVGFPRPKAAPGAP